MLAQLNVFYKIEVDGRSITLFSDGTWQYNNMIDHVNLLDTLFYEPAENHSLGCRQMFCTYPKSSKLYTLIKPFSINSIIRDTSCMYFSNEFYKESDSDPFLQIRSRLTNNSIKLFVQGYQYAVFPIDTLKKTYLLKIYHVNGLESWYYPVLPHMANLSNLNAGSIIATSWGDYYYQIRYQNRTFSPDILLNSHSSHYSKPFFIENIFLSKDDWEKRTQGFMQSIQSIVAFKEVSYDFQKLLDEEIEKNKQ